MRLLIALALAGCSAARTIPTAPAAPAAVVAPDDELAPHLVVSGNRAVSTPRLRADLTKSGCDTTRQIELVIATAPTGQDTPVCGTPDAYRIAVEASYVAEGFLEAKASLITRHGGPTTIAVVEGPRFVLGSIVAVEPDEHDRLADPGEIARVLALQPGERFNRDRIVAAMRRLTTRYTAAGYRRANVTPIVKVDPQTHVVALTLEIERGEIEID